MKINEFTETKTPSFKSGELDNAVFEDWYNDYWKPIRDAFPNKVAAKLSNHGYDPYNKSSVKQFVKNNPNLVKSLGQDAKKYANTPDWIVKGAGNLIGLSTDQTDFAINMRNKLKKERPDVWNDVTHGNVKDALKLLGISENVSIAILEHIERGVPFRECIFRPGSQAFREFYRTVRDMHSQGLLECDWEDEELLETDIGELIKIEGEIVPLDVPFILEELDEAEYQGKNVELNKPKRGGSKKFYVYVKNPKTGKVKKVSWGDTTGLKTKTGNKGAVKSFVARHKCKQKNDKTKAGYWACRTPRYKSLGVKGGQWW